jgi:hypothetical protein
MFNMERLAKVVGVAVFLASPLPAFAQSYTAYREPGVSRAYGPPSGSGQTVTLGGGVMNFTGSGARSVAEGGGAWNLRLGWGTRRVFGFEAAYLGSANKLTASGLDPNAILLGTGAEGALRFNIPVVYRDSLIEPFAFGGLGWTRFDVVNDDFNASTVREKDHIMTVPFGAGMAAAVRGFMVDARFTYRLAYDEELIGSTDLDNWLISANIGSEF